MANRKEVYTLQEIAAMTKEYLVPAEVYRVLGCSQYFLSVASETSEGRARLGFPVIRIGSRTKIPRRPFLKFMGWDGPIA